MSSNPITPEDVIWAYRTFLDREPESEVVIAEKITSLQNIHELVEAFIYSEEFKERNTLHSTTEYIWKKPHMTIEDVGSESDTHALF